MTSAVALMMLSLANAPSIEISTIEGRQYSGDFVSADESAWTIDTGEETVAVDQDSILEGRFSSADEPVESAPPHAVVLLDGSRLGTESVELSGETLTVKLTSDPIELPRTAVSSIRLAESPSEVDDAWQELLARDRREDWLVIRKEDKLDFVPGVVTGISSQKVSLLLDGDTVPVPRAKVSGVILRQRNKPKKAAGIVHLAGGNRLAVQSISSDGSSLSAELAAGPEVSLPLSNVRLLDFSAGKLTWLSSLQPRDVDHEFQFIDPAPALKNDRDVWGDPLRIGNRTFPRGVCIRSKTTVQYRLNGDYSRFQALMGIQFGYSGDVHVTISADGQELLSRAVTPEDGEPHPVDLDVTNNFLLEITVDYGEVDNDIGDHLVLADAKLLR